MKRNRLFTLTELLIVIAIIAILTAMIFPALQKANAMALRSNCSNNMRQGMMGIQSYAGDFGGIIPVMYKPNASAGAWYGWFWFIYNNAYMKSVKTAICPALKMTPPAPENYIIGSEHYGLNCRCLVNGVQGPTESLYPGSSSYIVHYSNRITNPSTLLYMADTMDTYWTDSRHWMSGLFSTSGSYYSIYLIHAGRANATYFDGHCGSVTRQDVVNQVSSAIPIAY